MNLSAYLFNFCVNGREGCVVPSPPDTFEKKIEAGRDQWYNAEPDFEEWLQKARAHQGVCDIHVMDRFSQSGKVAKAFEKLGFRGTTFDVVTGGASEDFSTKTGFETALFKSLRLLERGLVMCQPPCSLFIFF